MMVDVIQGYYPRSNKINLRWPGYARFLSPLVIPLETEAEGDDAEQGSQGEAADRHYEHEDGQELNGGGRVGGAAVEHHHRAGDGEDRASGARSTAYRCEPAQVVRLRRGGDVRVRVLEVGHVFDRSAYEIEIAYL